MQHNRNRPARLANAVAPFLSVLLAVSQAAVATHPPKSYPESGKVIATGLNEHTKSHPA